MLFSLKEIQGYQVRAADGDFGKVTDFLIDDFEWAVRYAIIEAENHPLLLSVLALERPETSGKVIPVRLTRKKIRTSPTIDFSQPISRQIERNLNDYYDWPYYWETEDVPNTLPGDLTAIPLIDMELEKDKKEEEQEKELIPQTGPQDLRSNRSESHLRSANAVFGMTVHASNDNKDAGKVFDIVTGDEDWNILYLVVDTGGILGGKKVLVAPTWVDQFDDTKHQVDINLSSETIHNSPEFRSTLDLTDDYQSRLRDYYNQ